MFSAGEFYAAIARKGERQRDAARIMGINTVTLYRKIYGESDFYRKEIDAFCGHYECDPNTIFFAKEVS